MNTKIAATLVALTGAYVAQANMIVNGDFSAGNTGFTSVLSYSTGSLTSAAVYTVGFNPRDRHSLWQTFTDHTTGTGTMLIVNGSTSAGLTRFWSQSVMLLPGRQYRLRAFGRSCYEAIESIDLSVGGVTLPGSDFVMNNSSWSQWDFTFTYSGVTGPTMIGMNSNSTSFQGNDYAVDDISLVEATISVSGTLQLQDTGVFAGNRNIAYSVVQGTVTLSSGTVVASASSSSLNIPVPSSATGAATVVFDGSSFLRKSAAVTLTDSPVALGTVSCQNGDVDQSGEVDAADIDAVIADFGSAALANTDVDVSGEVDAADIDIVIANFGGVDQ